MSTLYLHVYVKNTVVWDQLYYLTTIAENKIKCFIFAKVIRFLQIGLVK